MADHLTCLSRALRYQALLQVSFFSRKRILPTPFAAKAPHIMTAGGCFTVGVTKCSLSPVFLHSLVLLESLRMAIRVSSVKSTFLQNSRPLLTYFRAKARRRARWRRVNKGLRTAKRETSLIFLRYLRKVLSLISTPLFFSSICSLRLDLVGDRRMAISICRRWRGVSFFFRPQLFLPDAKDPVAVRLNYTHQ